MRRMFVGLTAAAFAIAFGSSLLAKTETVKGKIVDVGCYKMDKSNTGNNHKMPAEMSECATACAKEGKPMAILTDDGKVYELTGGLAADKNAKIIPHIAHTVEVTGDVTEKGGRMTIAADSLKMISR
ncbi:MAG TPA: hypothetical protein VEU08_01770 [Vicinamibacterales bacterium]|nr:hypothetical protein [Vicinamibacterales bacterium]